MINIKLKVPFRRQMTPCPLLNLEIKISPSSYAIIQTSSPCNQCFSTK